MYMWKLISTLSVPVVLSVGYLPDFSGWKFPKITFKLVKTHGKTSCNPTSMRFMWCLFRVVWKASTCKPPLFVQPRKNIRVPKVFGAFTSGISQSHKKDNWTKCFWSKFDICIIDAYSKGINTKPIWVPWNVLCSSKNSIGFYRQWFPQPVKTLSRLHSEHDRDSSCLLERVTSFRVSKKLLSSHPKKPAARQGQILLDGHISIFRIVGSKSFM